MSVIISKKNKLSNCDAPHAYKAYYDRLRFCQTLMVLAKCLDRVDIMLKTAPTFVFLETKPCPRQKSWINQQRNVFVNHRIQSGSNNRYSLMLCLYLLKKKCETKTINYLWYAHSKYFAFFKFTYDAIKLQHLVIHFLTVCRIHSNGYRSWV